MIFYLIFSLFDLLFDIIYFLFEETGKVNGTLFDFVFDPTNGFDNAELDEVTDLDDVDDLDDFDDFDDIDDIDVLSGLVKTGVDFTALTCALGRIGVLGRTDVFERIDIFERTDDNCLDISLAFLLEAA